MIPQDSTSSPIPPLNCAGILLSSRPHIMGILNVTPDSFSDGGDHVTQERALAKAQQMVAEGATIIDIGGESTRPGAEPVGVQQEIDRILPVIQCIQQQLPVIISVDTSKPEVMQAAIAAGVHLINDVNALQTEGAIAAIAASSVAVCLMHRQGEPRTMQHRPTYTNVVQEVYDFLAQRVNACQTAGIQNNRLVIDPGFGFGKTLEHNLSLVKHLSVFTQMGLPLLVGISRKSMIGRILDKPVHERLYGSLTFAILAAWQGATIIRAHDIAATQEALRIIDAVYQAN